MCAAKNGNREARILVVDNQPSNLQALEAMLEPLGEDLILAYSGREALRHVLRQEFALIILDVLMPELDGFETARLIRQRERSHDTPIIFLTGLGGDPARIERGYALGAVDYLIKPIEPAILLHKARVFLTLFQAKLSIRHEAEQLAEQRQGELCAYKAWSETRYGNLADAMPQIVWAANAEGELTYANQRWFDCAGPGERALEWPAVLYPADLLRFCDEFERALSSGLGWEAEFRLGSRTQGHYRWHLLRAIPQCGPEGIPVSWVGTATDLDDKKHAEQALRMLAVLTGRMAGLLDGDHSLEQVLESTLPVLGDAVVLQLNHEDPEQRRRVEVTHKSQQPLSFSHPQVVSAQERVLSQGSAEEYLTTEHRAELDLDPTCANFVRHLKEVGITAYLCFPLQVRGRTLGCLTFINSTPKASYQAAEVELAKDVTRRLATALDNLQLHEASERNRLRLEEAARAKDIFLATLSHELRTPLNAIVGWGDLLKGGELPAPRRARAIDTIQRNARALVQLVADLMEISRAQSGNVRLSKERVRLLDVVEGAIDSIRPHSENIGLDLVVEGERREELVVWGDSARLQQAVVNLLSNAIKFSEPGGRISLTLTSHGKSARIQVDDTGQGISPEFLPQVFERFRQAPENHGRGQRGIGIGLAIVKQLVNLHGGEVSAYSEGIGKGASFVIKLPLCVEPGLETVAGVELGSSSGSSETSVFRGMTILVVEDDPDNGELLETILAKFGARTRLAASASQALEAIAMFRPDLLISDIGLPDEDGCSLLDRIRSLESCARLPAIAVTALVSRKDVKRIMEAGFQECLSKPIDLARLTLAIGRVRDQRSRSAPDQVN